MLRFIVAAKLLSIWLTQPHPRKAYYPRHGYKRVRDGRANIWAGEIASVAKTLYYRRKGARTYELYTGRKLEIGYAAHGR